MSPTLPVAIIGGGLCGLALAIGLQDRGVPFVLYEARASLTEIGAGISVGPSALQALRLLRPRLGALVYSLATRNPAPFEDVFMLLRNGGRADASRADAGAIAHLDLPPTGSMTLHRQDFLRALAEALEEGRARFGKRLVGYEVCGGGEEGVRLEFADGSVERAGVVVAADGIHSQVRSNMFGGPGNPLSHAHYNGEGVYRAVIPMDALQAAIGGEVARRSTIWLGPGGYIIMYPVNGGKQVNCGVWVQKPGPWERSEWVLKDQRGQMEVDMREWGQTVQKLLALFPQDVMFWAAHQHQHQPQSVRDQKGRVILIGDAAHAMPPHQGAGAAMALEDAYVLAEVLKEAHEGGHMDNLRVDAALRAVEEVRGPRSAKVHQYSCEARDRWARFHEKDRKGHELEEFLTETKRRWEWIWNVDMASEAVRATMRMAELVESEA